MRRGHENDAPEADGARGFHFQGAADLVNDLGNGVAVKIEVPKSKVFLVSVADFLQVILTDLRRSSRIVVFPLYRFGVFCPNGNVRGRMSMPWSASLVNSI